MKNTLLIITGSIAAVKSYDLIRQLIAAKLDVTVVLTESAKEFVTPIACSALTGNKIYDKLFDLESEVEMDHIQLSRSADLVLVAPATANIIAKIANGISDDLASTLLLATNKPVVIAPAMNVKMWENKAVQRNIAQLREDGVQILEPDSGDLACGEVGQGRMVEPLDIVKSILDKQPSLPLLGKKALVTSGPTIETIDPVRYITNRSSGKQGYAVANALAEAGAEVVLVSGPTQLDDPDNVKVIKVESAKEMYEAVMERKDLDIAVCAAAVADWGVEHASSKKIKKQGAGDDFTFTFVENPDILKSLSISKNRPKFVVGFAAETEHLIENAKVKLEQKKCDMIVANNVAAREIFESNENEVYFIASDTQEALPVMSKASVAKKLVDYITDLDII